MRFVLQFPEKSTLHQDFILIKLPILKRVLAGFQNLLVSNKIVSFDFNQNVLIMKLFLPRQSGLKQHIFDEQKTIL